MKKLLCITLATLMLLTALGGCNIQPNQPEVPNDNISTTPPIDDDDYDIIIGGNTGETNPPEDNPPEENPPEDNPPEENPPEDNTPEDNPPEDNPPATEAPESSQVASGFVAKQKKYDYGENNIIILNVTNQNEKNYSVTINGFYLDADGKVIKSETQSVEGYAAGYEKYFLFNPDTAFESFIFTLTATEFSGQCYEQNWKNTFTGLMERMVPGPSGPNERPDFEPGEPCWGIQLRSHFTYPEPPPYILVQCYYIVIGNDGDIWGIYAPVQHGVETAKDNETIRCTIHYAHTQEELWPDELKDGVTCIIVHEARIWENWPDDPK